MGFAKARPTDVRTLSLVILNLTVASQMDIVERMSDSGMELLLYILRL